MFRPVLGVLAVLFVVGCANPQVGGSKSFVSAPQTESSGGLLDSRILAGNEAGVTLRQSFFSTQQGRLQVADEHCKKYGKVAQLAQIQERKGYSNEISYNCVRP